MERRLEQATEGVLTERTHPSSILRAGNRVVTTPGEPFFDTSNRLLTGNRVRVGFSFQRRGIGPRVSPSLLPRLPGAVLLDRSIGRPKEPAEAPQVQKRKALDARPLEAKAGDDRTDEPRRRQEAAQERGPDDRRALGIPVEDATRQLAEATPTRIDMNKIGTLAERNIIKATRHPTLPLTIYDYIGWSQRKRGNPEDQALVIQCRGLIVNDNGEIVARPFPAIHDLRPGEELPQGNFTVTDKLDGTLGIQYFVNGVPYLATRRAFQDPYGRIDRATARLREYAEQYPFREDITYLWESIDPRDKHIVDYGNRADLNLLAMIETATGRELPLPDQSEVPFPVVQRFTDIQTTEQLRHALQTRPESEGFVVRMDESGQRYRIKTGFYEWRAQWRTDVRRGQMPVRIWRHFFRGGDTEDLLSRVPEQDKEEAGRIIRALQTRYAEIEQEAREGGHPKVSSRMGRNLDYSTQIWEAMKPKPPQS